MGESDKRWRRVATGEPIDRVARRVSRRGESFSRETNSLDSEAIPRCVPFPGPSEHNLTGRRFGDLHVVGYLAPDHETGYGFQAWEMAKSPGQWVSRCPCGVYTTRTTKKLKRSEAMGSDCCRSCDDERAGKRRDATKRLGSLGAGETRERPALSAFTGPHEHDITGDRFGALIVVGYAGSGVWASQCSCGVYVTRRSRSLRNTDHPHCTRCDGTATAPSTDSARQVAETGSPSGDDPAPCFLML